MVEGVGEKDGGREWGVTGLKEEGEDMIRSRGVWYCSSGHHRRFSHHREVEKKKNNTQEQVASNSRIQYRRFWRTQSTEEYCRYSAGRLRAMLSCKLSPVAHILEPAIKLSGAEDFLRGLKLSRCLSGAKSVWVFGQVEVGFGEAGGWVGLRSMPRGIGWILRV